MVWLKFEQKRFMLFDCQNIPKWKRFETYFQYWFVLPTRIL